MGYLHLLATVSNAVGNIYVIICSTVCDYKKLETNAQCYGKFTSSDLLNTGTWENGYEMLSEHFQIQNGRYILNVSKNISLSG